jgi:pimeloyl-ACP methyl ester carboxylesterase
MRQFGPGECEDMKAAIAAIKDEIADRFLLGGEQDTDESAGTLHLLDTVLGDTKNKPFDATRKRGTFVIFIQGMYCAGMDWDAWTRKHVGDAAESVGLCNPDNHKAMRAVVRRLLFHAPTKNRFVRKIIELVSAKLETHRVIIMGYSYGGAVASSVAESLSDHVDAKHLSIRTFGSSHIFIRHPDTIPDWINVMFKDDVCAYLNGLDPSQPKDLPHGFEYAPQRRVLWLKPGHQNAQKYDFKGMRQTIHLEYYGIIKRMLTDSELRDSSAPGEALSKIAPSNKA